MEKHVFIVRHLKEMVRGRVEFVSGKGGSSLEIRIPGRKDLEMELRRYLTRNVKFTVPGRKLQEGEICGMKEIQAKPISSTYAFCSAMSMLPGQLGEGWRLVSHETKDVYQREHKG